MSRRKAKVPWWIVAAPVVLVIACCGGIMNSVGGDPTPSRSPEAVVTTRPVATLPATEEAEPTPTPEPAPSEPEVEVEEEDTDLDFGTVTAGAYCSTQGARGVTKKGTRMVCKGPGRLRWRSA